MPASKAARERHRRSKLIRREIRHELAAAGIIKAETPPAMLALRTQIAIAAAVSVTAPPVIVFLLWLFGA